MTRKSLTLAALALLLSSGAAMAPANADDPNKSAECKEITARLVEATNSTFAGYSDMGYNVFFKHPDMSLSCTSHRLTGVSLSWNDNDFPPHAWFVLAAKAGQAVTGVDAKTLEDASRKCHRLALSAAQDGLTIFEIPNAEIECAVSGSVFMSIWMNDHEARKGVEE